MQSALWLYHPIQCATSVRTAVSSEGCHTDQGGVPSTGGRYASSVSDTCGTTPGTLRSRSSFSRHTGLRCIICLAQAVCVAQPEPTRQPQPMRFCTSLRALESDQETSGPLPVTDLPRRPAAPGRSVHGATPRRPEVRGPVCAPRCSRAGTPCGSPPPS